MKKLKILIGKFIWIFAGEYLADAMEKSQTIKLPKGVKLTDETKTKRG